MSYRMLVLGEILAHWNELVPADLENFQPESGPQLAEVLQARYGFCRKRAEREAESFLADFTARLRRAVAA
jgi:hypothetical protein